MGAGEFISKAKGENAKEAFSNAVSQAQYEYGHAGYTGTIAEKDSFVLISLPEGEDAYRYALKLIEEQDERIDDKWGPAGCIHIEGNEYLFFGLASN